MSAKNGRLSMLSPGNGIGWILSAGARRVDGNTVRSIRRVFPLAAGYSGLRWNLRPISSIMANSISRNSMGTLRMVIDEDVTIAAVGRLRASIGSWDGEESTARVIPA